jgi:PAS domain S-box-containing protein
MANDSYRFANEGKSAAVRYILAAALAWLAVYMRVLLGPWLGWKNPYHTVWAVVVFSSWYCGLGPSILSVLVGLIGIWWWLLPVPRSLSGLSSADAYGMVGFLFFSAFIVLMGEANRRSQRKMAAAQLQAQRARALFESFMDHSPTLTYLKDEAGRFVYANRTIRERFGIHSIVGKTDLDFFPPELAAEYRQNDALVLSQDKAMEFTERTAEQDGEHIWLSIKFPLVDGDGKRLLGGKSFDITDRHRAEEALKEIRRDLEVRVQERTAQLSRANESLRDLSARLLQIKDQEGRRLARELHDSVGQLLAAISMNVANLESRLHNDAGREVLHDIAQLVDQTVREIRTISHLLHPPLLDEAGLSSALRWYVDTFSERSKIRVETDLPVDLDRLPTEMEISIFRIVQECLANINRHSGSETAAVRIRKQSDGVMITAQDFGCGIPPDKMPGISDGRGGVGFRGMAERIRFLGGQLKVESNSGGTTVTAYLPLPHGSVPKTVEAA